MMYKPATKSFTRHLVVLLSTMLFVLAAATAAQAIMAEETTDRAEPAPTLGIPAPEDPVAEDPAPADPASPAPEPGAPLEQAPEPGNKAIEIAPVPADQFYPAIQEEPTPKLSATDFGVGWPAAAAVGFALLAVLGMALMWRRDEVR